MLSAFGASRDYDSFDIIPVRCVSRVNFLSHGRHLPACTSHPSSSVSFQHTLSGQAAVLVSSGGRARSGICPLGWDPLFTMASSPLRRPSGRLCKIDWIWEGLSALWLAVFCGTWKGWQKKIQGGCVDCSRAIRAGRGWRLAMVAGWSLGTSDFKVSFLSLTNDHSDGRR